MSNLETIKSDFQRIKELGFILPPIVLQNQFTKHIEAIEKQKQQAQESLVKAEELFGALLQGTFKGGLG